MGYDIGGGERSCRGALLALFAAVACGPASPAPVTPAPTLMNVTAAPVASVPVASTPRAPPSPEVPTRATSSVRADNQTTLGAAAFPFATYLNSMHRRIHPLFSDAYLGSLDALPADDPLNDMKLITRLEIVLTRDGHIAKMGVVRTSGVSAFDIAALESVQRASPFGAAPDAILSPDGNVYLHWEFHRAATFGCSTMNARPYLLSHAAE